MGGVIVIVAWILLAVLILGIRDSIHINEEKRKAKAKEEAKVPDYLASIKAKALAEDEARFVLEEAEHTLQELDTEAKSNLHTSLVDEYVEHLKEEDRGLQYTKGLGLSLYFNDLVSIAREDNVEDHVITVIQEDVGPCKFTLEPQLFNNFRQGLRAYDPNYEESLYLAVKALLSFIDVSKYPELVPDAYVIEHLVSKRNK